MANEIKEYVYTDSSEVEHKIHIYDNSFDFAQKDKAIHDTKFLTKPTTFLKDAFRRFCKNKSSVAGAIILGILLLGSLIIPLAVPYDINVNHPTETFLEPKLFPAGTGFWDGTKRMENIPVDPATIEIDEATGVMTGTPYASQYPARAISNVSEVRYGYVTSASNATSGGFVNITNGNSILTADEESYELNKVTFKSANYNFDLTSEDYSLDIVLLNEEVEDYPIGDYRVYLSYDYAEVVDNEENADEETSTTETVTSKREIVLLDYDETPQYIASEEEDAAGNVNRLNTLHFDDITAGFRDESIVQANVSNIALAIDLRPNIDSSSSLFIENISVKNVEKEIGELSWKSANDFILGPTWTTTHTNGDPKKVSTSLYNGVTYVCDFTLDTYAIPYGVQTKTLSKTELSQYAKNGWIAGELADDVQSKEILDRWFNYTRAGGGTPSSAIAERIQPELDELKTPLSETKLPIISIQGVIRTSFTDPSTNDVLYSYTITATVYGYKYLGYDSMPIYLMGTDNFGYDLLKRTFAGLATSLGLGILIFLICFSFGLIYGAICGYFGGAIDIILQRFCDLLSGVPWIVIMTLCILNLGSNFGTFILAMCLTGWIGTASLTRTQFYRFRDREYTLASRTLGASNFRLIFKHILPNAMGTIITSAVLMIPSVIFSEASISYLGLGFQDMQSLGVVLSDNQAYLQTYPYLIFFPSVIMALIMISFNLFGNGLRDAFNPSLKGSD